jgi:nucleoside-diphosphate-sugar epimerase
MADMSEYGPAKVACEAHVRAAFGDDGSLIARAGLIGGPGDWSGRTGYWPWRLAHPSNPEGQVLVPDIPDFPCQVIDVRDLADWLVRCAEDRATGTVNASGDTIPFTGLLDTAGAGPGARPTLVSADPAWLIDQGVEEWMGPRSLPMWLADPEYAGFTSRSNAAARAMGLRPRPLVETLRDVLVWEQSRPAEQPRQAGLSDAEERELLGALTGGGAPASAH